MSVYAYIACPARRLAINLGTPLRRPDRSIYDFSPGLRGADRALLDRALWKFFGDAAGTELVIGFDDDDFYEREAVYYRWISPDAGADGIPLGDYVEQPVRRLPGQPEHIVTEYRYYRSLVASGADHSIGLYRRRFVDGRPDDQMFGVRNGWRPTWDLLNYEHGLGEREFAEISAANAEEISRA